MVQTFAQSTKSERAGNKITILSCAQRITEGDIAYRYPLHVTIARQSQSSSDPG